MGKARRKKSCRRMAQESVHQNMRFGELRLVLLDEGFEERVRGSHHVFMRRGLKRPLNLQPINGGKCKGYQVRQVLDVLRQLQGADVAA